MITDIIAIVRAAGQKILTHYRQADTKVQRKDDNSPLTLADRDADDVISKLLRDKFPDIPVLSEEGIEIPYEERKIWNRFWLVDPLDGTREFIKKTGEFTVNIALMDENEPVLGVIYAPATGICYIADIMIGAYKWVLPHDGIDTKELKADGLDESNSIHSRQMNMEEIAIVASRDHAGPMVRNLAGQLPEASFVSMGSSLKFCLVAEGKADIYLRDVPTMEWDTAAAHAIIKACGGEIYTLDGRTLTYNKPLLKNPAIIAVGDTNFEWQPLVRQPSP